MTFFFYILYNIKYILVFVFVVMYLCYILVFAFLVSWHLMANRPSPFVFNIKLGMLHVNGVLRRVTSDTRLSIYFDKNWKDFKSSLVGLHTVWWKPKFLPNITMLMHGIVPNYSIALKGACLVSFPSICQWQKKFPVLEFKSTFQSNDQSGNFWQFVRGRLIGAATTSVK